MAVSDRKWRLWKLVTIFLILFACWRFYFREEGKAEEPEFVEHLVDVKHTERRKGNEQSKEVNSVQDRDGEEVISHIQDDHESRAKLMDDHHVHMDLDGPDFAVNVPGGFEIMRMVKGEWHTDPTVCQSTERFPVSRLATPTGDIMISLYSSTERDTVSTQIRESGKWELDIVTTLHQLLQKNPDWVFIDIGAHLGVYTLSLAKAGYDVIALEPLVPNIQRICQSLELGEYKGIVRVVHNAVSDKMGNIALRNEEGRQFTEETIMLDELAVLFLLKSVIVRIDTGKHQLNVLKGATQFFSHVKVRYLLMDIPKDVQNTVEGKEILMFLADQNMKPAKPANPKMFLSTSGRIDWPTSVLWVRT